MNTETTTTAAPAPTAQHHFNFALFLQILASIAPVVVAPFVKNPQSQQILATETQVLEQVLSASSQAIT